MRKTIIKKVLALVLSVCACAGGMIANTGAVSAAVPTPTPGISPQYTAITATSTGIIWRTSEKLNCQGSTNVRDGYNAEVIVELQRNNNGDWETIKTWSDSGDGIAMVDEDYYALNSSFYRVKTTHRSYTSGWSLIETVVKYSRII